MFKRVASAVGSKNRISSSICCHTSTMTSTTTSVRNNTQQQQQKRLYQTTSSSNIFKTTKPVLSLKKQLGVQSKVAKEEQAVSSATVAEDMENFQMDAHPRDFNRAIIDEIYSGELFDIYSRMPLLIKRDKKQGDVPYVEEPDLAPTFSDEFGLGTKEESEEDSVFDGNTIADSLEKELRRGEQYEEEKPRKEQKHISYVEQVVKDTNQFLKETEEFTLTEEEEAEFKRVQEEVSAIDTDELRIMEKIVDRLASMNNRVPKSILNPKAEKSAEDFIATLSEFSKLTSEMKPLATAALSGMATNHTDPRQDSSYTSFMSNIDELAKYLTYLGLKNHQGPITDDLVREAKLFGFDVKELQKDVNAGRTVPIPDNFGKVFSQEAVEEYTRGILQLPIPPPVTLDLDEDKTLQREDVMRLGDENADEEDEKAKTGVEENIEDLDEEEEFVDEEEEAIERQEKEIKERYNNTDLSLTEQFDVQMGNSDKVNEVLEDERGKEAPDATSTFTNFRNKPQFNEKYSIPTYVNHEDIKIAKKCNVFDVAKQFGIKLEDDSLLTDLSDLTPQEKSEFIEKQLEIVEMPFQSVQAQRKEIKERQAKEKGEEIKTEYDKLEEFLDDEITRGLTLEELPEEDLEEEEEDQVEKAHTFVDTVVFKHDNPYEPFLLATHPHLFVNADSHFSETDIGRLFVITPEKYKKYFSITGTGGDLDKSFTQIMQRALLVREPVLPVVNEIQSLAKNKRKQTTDPGYLFTGIQGSGKSACLATCVYNAYLNGVLVVHIPSAYHWTYGIHFVEPSPVLQGYFDAPLPTRDFLKAFMSGNIEILKKMKLSRTFNFPLEPGQKMPTTLYELCEYALLIESNISVIFKFIMDELINDKETPMLFAIDDYNFLHDYTYYHYGNLDDFTTTPPQRVHAKNYTLVRAINRIIQQNAPNKLVVAANTNKYKTPNRVYIPKDEVLDPVYVPPRYTYEELENIVEFYQASAFVFGDKEDFMEDLLFMSGGVPHRVFKHMTLL
ncbi:hypothetical protein C9374_007765 [Naegleria lovaniensis]|uniref:Small ribosomal subunit protein mS29 n=1 Tax=Naegleria lovaniensis TaxID=51637 RepID=A0AA88GKM9_NAELO|nr:uncharacterized protein C9374_007765 [Naegleria lovaniensis]KAG2379127.1 hypothetical protein C9374_007765 [Naegleria lovaniensis]